MVTPETFVENAININDFFKKEIEDIISEIDKKMLDTKKTCYFIKEDFSSNTYRCNFYIKLNYHVPISVMENILNGYKKLGWFCKISQEQNNTDEYIVNFQIFIKTKHNETGFEYEVITD